MKLLTQEEEDEHYRVTLQGGFVGGTVGFAAGLIGVVGASRRYAFVRGLTLPLKTFLVTSTTTFGAIIWADRQSRGFEKIRRPELYYEDSASRELRTRTANEPVVTRVRNWISDNKYTVLGVSWVTSISGAFALVARTPGLSLSQKIVQSRVWAQGLTVMLLLGIFSLEVGESSAGTGRYEKIQRVDPKDPTHKHMIEQRVHKERYAGEDQWRDMVAAEEQRLKTEDSHLHKIEERNAKKKKRAKNVALESKHEGSKANSEGVHSEGIKGNDSEGAKGRDSKQAKADESDGESVAKDSKSNGSK